MLQKLDPQVTVVSGGDLQGAGINGREIGHGPFPLEVPVLEQVGSYGRGL